MAQSFFEQLRHLVTTDQISFDGKTDTPALEWLYMQYIATYPIQNERIRELSIALNRALCFLPFSGRDQIFSLSNRLSAEYERLAFIEGLKLGALIMNEFQKENCEEKNSRVR